VGLAALAELDFQLLQVGNAENKNNNGKQE
jgi:hypothetical protein